MNAVLICPDRRAEVAFLARSVPLALLPILGPALLFHWLTDLAHRGVKAVTLLVSDRPDQVRAAVGRGERWGLKIDVVTDARECSVAEARARFQAEEIVMADHLPGLPEHPLFGSYAGFFAALQAWLPLAPNHRVGAKEIQAGVWAGLRSRIDPTARLVSPCWLGESVWVRAGAVIGPHAYVEDSALVDRDAEVLHSWVGPATYVGAMTRLNQSFGWADGLLHHARGSFTEIVDPFLLSDLRGHRWARRSPWYGRCAALLVSILTSPLVLIAAIRNRGSGQPLFARKRAVVPTAVPVNAALREMEYTELNGVTGLARRWPQLWRIVCGDFTWVGNRPLTREQAAQLETEFDQLWLAAPVGWISLADSLGCAARFDDEARAHSSYYAVRADGRLDCSILRWLFLRSSPKI